MFVDGVYKLLYIKVSGTFFPIGCLTDNSFEESVEMIDTTVRTNTDGWATSRPTKQQFSASFSGLIDVDSSATIVGFRDIQALKRGRTKIEWKIENSQGGKVDYGEGYITSLSDAATIDEFISFSGTITGYGQPQIADGGKYVEYEYSNDYYE